MKKIFLNQIWIRLIMLSTTLIIYYSCSYQKIESTAIIIPDEYTGPVIIIFNQENGIARKYDGKTRIYEINNEGVLKTKFSHQFGYHIQKFYSLKNGERIEIPFLPRVTEKILDSLKNSTELFIYGIGHSGLGEKYDPNTRELISVQQPALSFYVGTINQYDSSDREMMKFIFEKRKDE